MLIFASGFSVSVNQINNSDENNEVNKKFNSFH